MAITLTEKAAKHVSRFMDKRGKGIGLRFGVRTTDVPDWLISWNMSTKALLKMRYLSRMASRYLLIPKLALH